METFGAAVDEMYDRGEAAVRKFIEVPEGPTSATGRWTATGSPRVDPVRAEVVVDGQRRHRGLHRTPDSRAGPVNSPLPSTVSATRVAITMLASASDPGGEGHFHEGHFRPIHVETRAGSMFHPEPPAPAFFYYMSDYQAIEVIFRAVAEALPTRSPRCSGGDVTTLIWWGGSPTRARPGRTARATRSARAPPR